MSTEEKQNFPTYQDSNSFEYPENEKEVSNLIKKFYKSNIPIELIGSGSKRKIGKPLQCSKTLSLSQSNLLSGTTRQTKPWPKLANAWHAWKSRPRIIICIMLAAIGAASSGCQNVREIDLGLGGLSAEFYEPQHSGTNSPSKGWFK